jgi:hypothetical protein
MPYTKLASYQFERGRGFTEESVFAFHSLALTAIYELANADRSASDDLLPLSSEEVELIVKHRAAAATAPVESETEPMSSYLSDEASAPLAADPSVAEGPESPATVALGSPPDDDFAAAARWLALATRNETEPYQPSLVRHRS